MQCTDYKAVMLEINNQVEQVYICTGISEYSGYKLTNEQMADFILQIAFLFATVAIFKWVKRSFL